MRDLNSELNFSTWNGVRLDFLCTLFFYSLATQPSWPKTHLSSKFTTVRDLNSQLCVGWSFTLSLTLTCLVPKLVYPSEALSSVECFHHKFTQNPPQTLYHTIYPVMPPDSSLLDPLHHLPRSGGKSLKLHGNIFVCSRAAINDYCNAIIIECSYYLMINGSYSL